MQAPSAAIGSTIGGTVTRVLVSDGARVRSGEVIVELDAAQESATYRNAVDLAHAADSALADLQSGSREPDLSRARALADQQRAVYERASQSAPRRVAVLEDQARQADAAAASARSAANEAAKDDARESRLFATGDVSAQVRDTARSRAAQTAGQLQAALAQDSAARSQLANDASVTIPEDSAAALEGYRAADQSYRALAIGARPNAVAQLAAAAAAAASTAANARARLDQMAVRAPADGVVSGLDIRAGDLIRPGAAVATIDEDGEPFVRVFVPQSDLGRWHVGAAVTVHPDSNPQATIAGTVESIDSQAQFTPQNVQTAEDRANLSFGLKVRIHDRSRALHGGTTASVTIP